MSTFQIMFRTYVHIFINANFFFDSSLRLFLPPLFLHIICFLFYNYIKICWAFLIMCWNMLPHFCFAELGNINFHLSILDFKSNYFINVFESSSMSSLWNISYSWNKTILLPFLSILHVSHACCRNFKN